MLCFFNKRTSAMARKQMAMTLLIVLTSLTAGASKDSLLTIRERIEDNGYRSLCQVWRVRWASGEKYEIQSLLYFRGQEVKRGSLWVDSLGPLMDVYRELQASQGAFSDDPQVPSTTYSFHQEEGPNSMGLILPVYSYGRKFWSTASYERQLQFMKEMDSLCH